MNRSRLLGALAATAGLLALGTPALAVTATCSGTPTTCVAGVPVSLGAVGGIRQFTVETVSGTDLTSIPLGTGGSYPFRTHVQDTGYSNLTNGYTVSATMSNLYLQSGATHDLAVKVPSSDVSLTYGSSPLSALGLSVADLPKLSVSGTLGSCATLPSAVQSVLGLSALGVVLDPSNLTVVNLCTALGAGVPIATTVDGALQTLTPTLSSLLDLPTALTGGTPGAFTNPAYAGTVGASDPAASGAPAATSLNIMTGTPGMTAGLTTALTNALNTALSGVPLVTSNDAGARTTLAALIGQLTGSASSTVSTLGNAVNLLTATQQASLLSTLASSVVAPQLTDIQAVDGNYYGFPLLHATPTAPVAGTYDGTLTVTFVQG